MNPTLYGTLLIAGVGTLIAMTLASTGQGVSAAFVAGVMVVVVGILCAGAAADKRETEATQQLKERVKRCETSMLNLANKVGELVTANAGAEGGSE